MRKRFEQQLDLGRVPIAEVVLPARSRDELPPVMAALRYIFITPELNERVFSILEEKICGVKKKTGRPGMDLWEILVLGSARMALDCDYDRLQYLANYDRLIRGIMGVEATGFGAEVKEYKYQTIRDNVALLDEELIVRINAIVVEVGHSVVNKKEGPGLKIKADTYVLETNVHYPTDTNLLLDAGRKCVDVMGKLSNRHGITGWRKHKSWQRGLKNLYRVAVKSARSGAKNKQERMSAAVGAYLGFARALDAKITGSEAEMTGLQGLGALVLMLSLDYYREMLRKHIDLVERRLLKGEVIPHEEKLFSIFEPHSEWISKGKVGIQAEIGHKILVATDQYHFILHHQVIENTSDYGLAVQLTKKLLEKYPDIASLSFDKGFFSKENKEKVRELIPEALLVMPKRGKLSQAEKEEEGTKAYKKAKRKHSAVESNINQLESNGLNRCPDKGMGGFKRYAALGVLSYNLHRLGKLLLEAERKKQTKKLQKAA
jgi:IS5 family transposase